MTIYVITNRKNGKRYVGQTRMTLQDRWKAHCWRAKRDNFALSAAIRKYGPQAFSVEALQTCLSDEDLNRAECVWIEKLNSLCPNGYNIRRGGSHGRHSAATIAKLKARVFTPEWRSKLSAKAKGRRLSIAQREAMSARQLGRKAPEELLVRHYRGEANPRAKLTSAEVFEIREIYKSGGISQADIAAAYGVNQTNVGFIVRGVGWLTNRL